MDGWMDRPLNGWIMNEQMDEWTKRDTGYPSLGTELDIKNKTNKLLFPFNKPNYKVT